MIVDPAKVAFTIPFLHHQIAWYGVIFAGGFFVGLSLFRNLVFRYLQFHSNLSLLEMKRKATLFADQIVFYIILGTVIGARLGHIIFYEPLPFYISHPVEIFKIWEGGLASHGGICGIMVALFFFYKKHKGDLPGLSAAVLLDLLIIPSAFVSMCIRIGNFMNQEILGTPSSLPWAVTFLHPIDGSMPIARHPVVLYEALFYFGVFIFLGTLFRKGVAGKKEGYLAGLFFLLVFLFRTFVEFFKAKEGVILPEGSLISMGQILSIPFVILGGYLLWSSKTKKAVSYDSEQ